MSHSAPPNGDPGPSSSASKAAYLPLSKHAFSSIEYPGPVSDPEAILKYTSQQDIDDVFNAEQTAKPELEIRFRGDAPGVPLRGQRKQTQKLLLKVTRRRRKRKGAVNGAAGEEADGGGVYTAAVAGIVGQTVRFRTLADYHWTPKPDTQVMNLLDSLKRMDYRDIVNFQFPDLDEGYFEPNPDAPGQYRSKLELQPPPHFASRHLPYAYNFKMPLSVHLEQSVHPNTGQPRMRLTNTQRWGGMGPTTIYHTHPLDDVPKEPPATIRAKLEELDPALLDKLRMLFEERPVWMRHPLMMQFSVDEQKEINRLKAYIPMVAYMMGTGPYWKCLIRLGYDPRTDPASRRYQRIFFYPNKRTVKSAIVRVRGAPEPEDEDEFVNPEDDDGGRLKSKRPKGWWVAEQARLIDEGKRPSLDPWKQHVFDGQYLHRERGDFQLCDITDPLVRRYVDDPSNLVDVCGPIAGWYNPSVFALIKAIVRTKYKHMWETGTPATDEVCFGVLEDFERGMLEDVDAGVDGDEPDGGEGEEGGKGKKGRGRGRKGGTGEADEDEDAEEAEAEESDVESDEDIVVPLLDDDDEDDEDEEGDEGENLDELDGEEDEDEVMEE